LIRLLVNVVRDIALGDFSELLVVSVEAPRPDAKCACSTAALTPPLLPKRSSFTKMTDEFAFATFNGGSFFTATKVTAMVSSPVALLPQDEVETKEELDDMDS
jgi:hypothetical protein